MKTFQSLALLLLLCRAVQVALGAERQELSRASEPEPGSQNRDSNSALLGLSEGNLLIYPPSTSQVTLRNKYKVLSVE